MKKITLLLPLLILANLLSAQNTQRERLQHHIAFMAADSLHGRQAGSVDAHKVALYLSEQYRDMGAMPLFQDYAQPFSLGDGDGIMNLAYSMMGDSKSYQNIVIVIPGNDLKLRHEYILVGGHYDHIGMKNGEVYNGADDNASGSAAMVELARNLLSRRSQLKRSVVICNFDAEEIGLCGSDALARALANKNSIPLLHNGHIFERISKQGMQFAPIEFCQLMMSVDMVGWYRQSGHLELQGTGTIEHGRRLVNTIAEQQGLNLRLKNFETSILTATDTEPFAKKGIPTLDVTTGLKSPYHKPQDDADLIDYDGLSQIVDYLTELVTAISQDDNYSASGRVAPKHQGHLPLFEASLSLGGGRNWVNFSHGAISTHPGWGWSGGADLLFNFDHKGSAFFSLRSGVLYTQSKCPFPIASDLIYNSDTYKQTSFEIPLDLQLNFRVSSLQLYLLGGAYYRGICSDNKNELSFNSGSVTFDPTNRIGFEYGIGLRVGHWDLLSVSKHQRMAPNSCIKMPSTRVMLTYRFW